MATNAALADVLREGQQPDHAADSHFIGSDDESIGGETTFRWALAGCWSGIRGHRVG